MKQSAASQSDRFGTPLSFYPWVTALTIILLLLNLYYFCFDLLPNFGALASQLNTERGAVNIGRFICFTIEAALLLTLVILWVKIDFFIRAYKNLQQSMQNTSMNVHEDFPYFGNAVLLPIKALAGNSFQVDYKNIINLEFNRFDNSGVLVRYVTASMVVLGLLGTFIGLSLAIQSGYQLVDKSTGSTVDSTKFTDSMVKIFAGMNTKFGSSILGIFASIILGLVEQYLRQLRHLFFIDLEKWVQVAYMPIAAPIEKSFEHQSLEKSDDLFKKINGLAYAVNDSTGKIETHNTLLVKTVLDAQRQIDGKLILIQQQMQKDTAKMVNDVTAELKKRYEEIVVLGNKQYQALIAAVAADQQRHQAHLDSLNKQADTRHEAYIAQLQENQTLYKQNLTDLHAFLKKNIAAFAEQHRLNFDNWAKNSDDRFQKMHDAMDAALQKSTQTHTEESAKHIKRITALIEAQHNAQTTEIKSLFEKINTEQDAVIAQSTALFTSFSAQMDQAAKEQETTSLTYQTAVKNLQEQLDAQVKTVQDFIAHLGTINQQATRLEQKFKNYIDSVQSSNKLLQKEIETNSKQLQAVYTASQTAYEKIENQHLVSAGLLTGVTTHLQSVYQEQYALAEVMHKLYELIHPHIVTESHGAENGNRV